MKINICANGHLINLTYDTENGYNLDYITAKHTAFTTFDDLIKAPGVYFPSLCMGRKSSQVKNEILFLTVAYNQRQRARNDKRRVYKSDWDIAHIDVIMALLENTFSL